MFRGEVRGWDIIEGGRRRRRKKEEEEKEEEENSGKFGRCCGWELYSSRL